MYKFFFPLAVPRDNKQVTKHELELVTQEKVDETKP